MSDAFAFGLGVMICLCCVGDGQVVVGFDTFIYKSVVPSCFLAPLKAEFDLRDGQTVIVSCDFVFCCVCHDLSVCRTDWLSVVCLSDCQFNIMFLSFCLSIFYLSVCLFVCLFVCLLFFCLSVSLFVCLSVCLFVCLSVCLSVCLFFCLTVCLFVCLSVCFCLSVCLSICLSVCLYVCLLLCWSVFVCVTFYC